MQIAIGSKNQAKVKAVQTIFPDFDVRSMMIDSSVSEQPYSDEETKKGAINRAKECMKQSSIKLAIGLEGGVMQMGNDLYLCNWGALVTRENKVYTAGGARIMLPKIIAEQLEEGKELGDVMDRYANREGIRLKEGAIGVFTNNFVSRVDLFIHVAALLRGQWEFSE